MISRCSVARDWMPPTETKYHPGLVGQQPDVALSADTITLHRTENVQKLPPDPHYRFWGQPRSGVSFKVGPLLAHVVEQSDVLHIHRGGTAEVGLVLSGHGALIMALGAVRAGALGDGNTFTEDSGEQEVSLYGVRHSLDDPKWSFVWLGTSEAAHCYRGRLRLACSTLQIRPPASSVI